MNDSDDRRGRKKDEPLAARREAMKVFGGALVLIGCGSSTADVDGGGGTGGSGGTGGGSGTGGSGGTGDAGPASCAVVPEETLGPYPDKALANVMYDRQDITEGRPGLALTVVLSVVDTSAACAAVQGASVIIWQCDAEGHYSEYSQPGYDGTAFTFLRGLQTTGATGQVTFKTIYPGWYGGRATHIHIQVLVGGVSKKVTQLAFPETINDAVYASGVYAARGKNPQKNASDMVFQDSLQPELGTVTGDTTSGYAAALTIGIAS
jgi:protocatechuate 3,4-dioxygenase beta subunit